MNQSEDTKMSDATRCISVRLGDIVKDVDTLRAEDKRDYYDLAQDLLSRSLKDLAYDEQRDPDERQSLKYREHRLRVAELALAVGMYWDKS